MVTRFCCVVCGKLTAGRLPRRGDGTTRYPRRHNRGGAPCDGNWQEARWVDIEVQGPKYQRYLLSPGERFGRLTVIRKEAGNPSRYINHYLCLCDCGQEKIALGAHLVSGARKSCGCLRRDTRSANGKRNRLPGDGNATRNSIITSYRRQNTSRRGLTCSLTDEEFDELFRGICFYCGIPPSRTARYGRAGATPFTYNGIDRVDNKRGYEQDNVVSCCLCCNRAKGKMNVKEFTTWIERAYLHLRSAGAFRP